MADLIIKLAAALGEDVVLSVGGFLEIGEKRVAVPLKVFAFNSEQGLLSLDADQPTLEDAPRLVTPALQNDPISSLLILAASYCFSEWFRDRFRGSSCSKEALETSMMKAIVEPHCYYFSGLS